MEIPVWVFSFGNPRLEIPVWRFPFRGSRLEVPVWRLPFRVPVGSKGRKLILSMREHRFCEVLETVKGMQQCKSQYYVHESNDFVDFGDMYHVLAIILLIFTTCLAFWPWSPRGIGEMMHGGGPCPEGQTHLVSADGRGPFRVTPEPSLAPRSIPSPLRKF